MHYLGFYRDDKGNWKEGEWENGKRKEWYENGTIEKKKEEYALNRNESMVTQLD